jgi:hypothetical protein
MVDLPDLPGAPRWDDAAADELVATVHAVARVLDEQWALFDRGWWELLTGWTGPARAAYNERLLSLREPVAHLRDELRVAPARVAAARDEAHEARRGIAYRIAPGLGLAWDVLDRVGG